MLVNLFLVLTHYGRVVNFIWMSSQTHGVLTTYWLILIMYIMSLMFEKPIRNNPGRHVMCWNWHFECLPLLALNQQMSAKTLVVKLRII